MIQAFVSGMTARVAFVDDANVSYINADRPTEIIRSSPQELRYLFLGADDIEQISVESPDETYDLLLRKFTFDRGLRLLDVALTDDEGDFRQEAAKLFENLIEHEAAFEQIKNYVFSAQNENIPEENDLASLRLVSAKFVTFVEEIRRAQVHILRFNTALDSALANLHIDQDTCEHFRALAVDSGAFRGLVEAGNDSTKINAAILSCYRKLSEIRDSRQIVGAWTKDVIHRTTRKEMRRLEEALEKFEHVSYAPSTASEQDGYSRYLAVRQQMDAIIEKVRLRDVRSARRFADQLIKMQVQNGDQAYAAKTLSSLAIEARKMGQHSLELEWALASVELVPDDGRGVGILADTYLDLFRIPEAEAEFMRAIALGEDEFGNTGLGRVQKACGRFDDALVTLANVMRRFSGSRSSFETHSAYAETLRALWRESEALKAYNDAIEKFPLEPSLLCGKAAVLTDLGRLGEAAAIYLSVNERFGDQGAAWCGLAEVRKREGAWDAALEIYDTAKQKFPTNVIAYCGHADVLRAKGAFDDALAAYKEAAIKFPYSPTPVSGEAETLKDMHRYSEALSVLKQGNEKFPLDSHLRNGYANAMKLDGQFAASLALFDQNVRDLPYNLFALSGRANLLRLLGDYDSALRAYDDIISRRPDYKFATNAKAAIFVAQGRFDEADAILPIGELETEVDWATLHIRGMLALKRGAIGEAKDILVSGTHSPFVKQRLAFETALSLLSLKLGDFDEASKGIWSHRDSVSKLIQVHILLRQGNSNLAADRYAAVNDNLPEPVVELRNRLGSALMSSDGFSSDDENWLFEREMEVILQAA